MSGREKSGPVVIINAYKILTIKRDELGFEPLDESYSLIFP
jgi:hypothetical protein